MTQGNDNGPETQSELQEENAAEIEFGESVKPMGPDLSGLTEQGRELLEVAVELLNDFDPEPGSLSELPQVTIGSIHALQACRLLKDDPRISTKMLLCLTCVDYSEYFQLVYVLQSLEPERTLVLKANVPYDNPVLPSVTTVWQAADWYEREAHDLFGVEFEGHPDLTPLLLYEGFEGYPGRKEYPFYEYQEF